MCGQGPNEAASNCSRTGPRIQQVSVAVAVTLADRARRCPELDTLSGLDEVIGRRAYHTRGIGQSTPRRPRAQRDLATETQRHRESLTRRIAWFNRHRRGGEYRRNWPRTQKRQKISVSLCLRG